MKITKTKDYVLFKNKHGEYHLSNIEFDKMGEHVAARFAEKEILKKVNSKFKAKYISFNSARELGFCEYGIKDFCKKLSLDIWKEYLVSDLLKILTTHVLFEYPNECRKIFGTNRIIKRFGGIDKILTENKNRRCFEFIVNNYKIPERTLRLLSCEIAFSCQENFTKIYPDDDRSMKAIEARLLHLEGLISDTELSTASYAASSAACYAANSTACYAACYAASSAANSANSSAASYATSYATYSTACYAAYYVACYAASSAAYSTASSTASSTAYSLFCEMLPDAISNNYETYDLFLKEFNKSDRLTGILIDEDIL